MTPAVHDCRDSAAGGKRAEDYAMCDTALIVGGTGALGAATCRAFAQSSWNVALTYRSSQPAAAILVDELKASGVDAYAAPLQLEASGAATAVVADVQERFGPVAAVVYAAGPDLRLDYVATIAAAEWRRVIESDVHAYFNLVQAVVPVFRAQKGGSLVAITTAAVRRYPVRDALSVVPKAAVEQLTIAVAREEGRFGTRANCVAPGIINAGLGARMMQGDLRPEVSAAIRSNIPLRRFGEADEVAEAVTFLASSRARYISGQILNVDGGWLV
jgi:NAD(P)-dependent dehydrogenase (short-subunit alcohol dehydrogenase family)